MNSRIGYETPHSPEALSAIEVRQSLEAELPAVLRLRYRVLDGPLGLPEKTEVSRHDLNEKTLHIAAFDGNTLVSTVRFEPYGEAATYLVRRMATDPAYQGKGIGSRVMQLGESLAKEQGAERMVLHARIGAIPFYEKLGYELTGRVEVHDGDENPEMTKDL